ncbi:hypothetical protein NDI76_19555 [Halogeometricum sp. S1BR25-6]|uniref:Uncharacterized protein n=1 Tax=Halogeometricum salsisoli TaxID=2950536 RepID=A0ABU2GJE2_9EURY|nr:hypothetical protein [Halogeometricum sp. S1BR25-6]MDS0300947.1 hypothetical protein [Halogeometricum sp. S1BR25-6]
MSQDSTPSQTSENRTDNHYLLTSTSYRQALLTLALVSLFAVHPAAAQTSAVCSADKLPSMIEGFFQLTTGLGIVGLAVVWQADSLIEMFTLNSEQKKGLKRHKRSAMKSAVILLVLGPLYTVAGSMMSLPLADCVNLTPW